MSRANMPVIVGNDFVVAQPRLRVATPVQIAEPAVVMPIITPAVVPAVEPPRHDFTPPVATSGQRRSPFGQLVDFMHRYSLATFALLFLLVGSTGIHVAQGYWAAHVVDEILAKSSVKPPVRTVAGLNIIVPADELESRVGVIASQPATITVGTHVVPISPDTIKSWLQITPSADKSESYIRIKADAIEASLLAAANKFVKAPTDQVTVTFPDGSAKVVVAGHDGTKLSNPADLKVQAAAVAKTVMDAKGMNFTAPLETQAFAATTPANFDKLIDVNITTKQMYLFEKGQLVKTYPISAGAAETPTPIGQFKTKSKLAVQNMSGYNPNGTKYFQPNVRWISYFESGGYAIHGNYWRPASWFGVVNSSHGCVSLPEAQAKEVFDWSPIGTTVITHR